MQLERGYLSPYFVTDPARLEVVLADVHILIHENKLSTIKDLAVWSSGGAQQGDSAAGAR